MSRHLIIRWLVVIVGALCFISDNYFVALIGSLTIVGGILSFVIANRWRSQVRAPDDCFRFGGVFMTLCGAGFCIAALRLMGQEEGSGVEGATISGSAVVDFLIVGIAAIALGVWLIHGCSPHLADRSSRNGR